METVTVDSRKYHKALNAMERTWPRGESNTDAHAISAGFDLMRDLVDKHKGLPTWEFYQAVKSEASFQFNKAMDSYGSFTVRQHEIVYHTLNAILGKLFMQGMFADFEEKK